MCDPEILEIIKLSRLLTEREGQRLHSYRNSPAILAMTAENHKLWIKDVYDRFTISLQFPNGARTCIYDNGPEGDDPVILGVWIPVLELFLNELRRRCVLDAVLFGAERNT